MKAFKWPLELTYPRKDTEEVDRGGCGSLSSRTGLEARTQDFKPFDLVKSLHFPKFFRE